MKFSLNSTGDTIVEVLISMAVVSSVLGGAYVVVNRTMANTRQAQEHAEALQIASEQIERIVTMSANDPAPLYDTTQTVHCINSSGVLVNQQIANLPGEESAYNAGCKNLGSVKYRTAFKYDAANNYFNVYVDWDGLTGGQDQVNLVYRTYKQ